MFDGVMSVSCILALWHFIDDAAIESSEHFPDDSDVGEMNSDDEDHYHTSEPRCVPQPLLQFLCEIPFLAEVVMKQYPNKSENENENK